MLFLLICGILFPHTHGYHYQQTFHTYSYPEGLGPYGSIYHGHHGPRTFQTYPENQGTHTFQSSPENQGTHTFQSSPENQRTHTFQSSPENQGTHTFQTSPENQGTHTFQTSPENQGTHTFQTFPENQGTHTFQTSPENQGTHTFQTSPENQGTHTFQTSPENQGTHTFQTYPEIHGTTTFEKSQPYGNSHGHYSWQTQWKKHGWIPNDGRQTDGQGTHGESQVGNSQDKPIQNKEGMFFPSEPTTTKPVEDTKDESKAAAETILKAPIDEMIVDDDSEPPPFPGVTSDDDDDEDPHPFPTKTSDYDDSEPKPFPGNNDDDDSDSESSADSEEPTTPGDTDHMYSDNIGPYTNPVRIGEASKPADEMNEDTTDQSSIGNSDFGLAEKKNTTNKRSRWGNPGGASRSWPYLGRGHNYIAGTGSWPVRKLGLLFAPSLQWHVGIYSKSFTPYMQVCGGSLVNADVVLSAAHCFWNDDVGALRPGLFAVAAGKLLRPWETEGETYTQHSDIKDIKIPPRFRGSKTSFQDDIAILLLTRALEYAPGVKPVCISFDQDMERGHLTSGNLGTIAGWGLTEPNGPPSQRLNYLKLPYVDIDECLRTAEDSFLRYITSDKICAGDQKTGRALCRGDSGGGLVYYSGPVPYLHGIASTAPRDGNECNAYAVATFTHVLAHRRFLAAHVPGRGECEGLYGVGSVQNKGEQENAKESNSPQIQEEDRMANLTPENANVSNAFAPEIPLSAPSNEGGDADRRPMLQNDGFTNSFVQQILTSQDATELAVTPMSESVEEPNEDKKDTNEDKNDTNEDSNETNEDSNETNEDKKDTNEDSNETNEDLNETNEEKKETNEVVRNVGSVESGVARIKLDNNTHTFVCNCFCNK